MAIDFNDCTLYMSLRSPFARRVRLAFLEHDLPFKPSTLDVFNPPPEFAKVNPLLRVPAVVLKSGHALIDSHSIVAGFYQANPSSSLIQKETNDLEKSLKWSGLGVGIAELLVQYYLECQREKSKQDESVLNELQSHFLRTLTHFEAEIGSRPFITAQGLSQADLDMGTALAYMKLRYNPKALEAFPATTKYLAGLDTRPSFKASAPPP